MLIAFAGLPGTGKSTITAALGRRLRSPVEVRCSDPAAHRARVESRRLADADYANLDWAAVERRMAEYEPWPPGEPHVALDTAGVSRAQMAMLVDRVLG